MKNLIANIYIIDDDDSMRTTLESILTAMSYNVKSFSNPTDFLKIDIERPAIIILDMILPDITGIYLQIELLKQNNTPPIIFISGDSTTEQIILAMKQGAIDFLPKPFGIKALIKAIKNGLKNEEKLVERLENQKILSEKLSLLTNRELQVYNLLIKGFNNQELMEELNVSLPTIKQYKMQVMQKLNTPSLSKLIQLSKKQMPN